MALALKLAIAETRDQKHSVKATLFCPPVLSKLPLAILGDRVLPGPAISLPTVHRYVNLCP